MAKDVETAKADLAVIVPHLRVAATDAIRRAKPGATVKLAIIAQNSDGTGTIGASFDCEEFISDLETVFPPTEDAILNAQADCLLAAFRPESGASA